MSKKLLAEWEKQSAVMITWPHEDTIWADTLSEANLAFAQVANAISDFQKVIISCQGKNHQAQIEQYLKPHSQYPFIFAYAACDDVWVRDHGPLTVIENQQAILLKFTFNGWGNKYPASKDNELVYALQQQHIFGKTPIESIDLVLEGGAIETDGQGTLLTTSRCLLSPTRNPTLNKTTLSEKLKSYFGVSQVIFLDHGALEGDDTDSHIDTLVRFINPNTLCYVACEDPSDPHYNELREMEKELSTLSNAKGEPYKRIKLPLPNAHYAKYDGRRLPATYANFLIINQAVLLPTYDDPHDALAIEVLTQAFPSRRIIPIPAVEIIQWYGSIHCMTMQLPEGVL